VNQRTVSDLHAMLAGMAPRLDEQAWVFAPVASDAAPPGSAFAVICEEEGRCAILPASEGPPGTAPFARIILQVHSDLEAVGLTAAVASALAAAGMPCNVIAGLHHDHLFVPWDARDMALAVLRAVSRDARA
jgi:hypothetical protein